MNDDPDPHAAAVSAWMAKSAKGLAGDRLLALLDAATVAVWQRARITLGDVTLAAIVDRVVSTASDRFAPFSAAHLKDDGVNFASLRERAPDLDEADLRAAIEFFLTELLNVLGSLTAEILTPALHVALSKVTYNETRDP